MGIRRRRNKSWFNPNAYEAVACLGLYKIICEYSIVRPMFLYHQILSWCLLHKTESHKNKWVTVHHYGKYRFGISFFRFLLLVSVRESNVLSFKRFQLCCFVILLCNIQIHFNSLINVHQVMTRVTVSVRWLFTLFLFYSCIKVKEPKLKVYTRWKYI